jgi:hypothetical protein
LWLASSGIGFPLLRFRGLLQTVEAGRQNVGQEAVQVREPLRPQAVQPARAVASLLHEPRRLEHLQVLGDRRLGHREARSHLPRAQLVRGQHPQHLAPLGLGDCLEELHGGRIV